MRELPGVIRNVEGLVLLRFRGYSHGKCRDLLGCRRTSAGC